MLCIVGDAQAQTYEPLLDGRPAGAAQSDFGGGPRLVHQPITVHARSSCSLERTACGGQQVACDGRVVERVQIQSAHEKGSHLALSQPWTPCPPCVRVLLLLHNPLEPTCGLSSIPDSVCLKMQASRPAPRLVHQKSHPQNACAPRMCTLPTTTKWNRTHRNAAHG